MSILYLHVLFEKCLTKPPPDRISYLDPSPQTSTLKIHWTKYLHPSNSCTPTTHITIYSMTKRGPSIQQPSINTKPKDGLSPWRGRPFILHLYLISKLFSNGSTNKSGGDPELNCPDYDHHVVDFIHFMLSHQR